MFWHDVYTTEVLLVQHHFAQCSCQLEFHILHFAVQKQKSNTRLQKNGVFETSEFDETIHRGFHDFISPAGIYMFKVNNKDTRTKPLFLKLLK